MMIKTLFLSCSGFWLSVVMHSPQSAQNVFIRWVIIITRTKSIWNLNFITKITSVKKEISENRKMNIVDLKIQNCHSNAVS